MPDDRTSRRIAQAKGGAEVLVTCLLLVSPYLRIPDWTPYEAATAVFTGIAATGLNMMLGYAGLLNLGGAFFFGFGGYGVGLSTQFLHMPIVVAIIVSALAAAAVAVPLGSLLVRLPRFYFAVATLGLAIALSGVITSLPSITGGASGLSGGGSLTFGRLTIESQTGWYVVALITVIPTVLVVKLMTRGRRDRGYAMLRQDELAASGLGIPVTRMKVSMFAAAAGVLSLGGGLLFGLQGVVVPDNAGVTQSVQLLGIAVIGGMTFPYGGFVGAALLIWLQSAVSDFGTTELLIYGGVFLVVVFFASDGLVGLWQRGWRALERRVAGPAPAAAGPAAAAVRGPAGEPAAVAHSVAAHSAVGSAPSGRLIAAVASKSRDLAVNGVGRAFGGVIAVDNVSFTVPRGSVTALIGHNGAGKTTLLNIISGFEPTATGSVYLGETRVDNRKPETRAQLGMTRSFQVPRLIDARDVAENVMLGADFSRPQARLGTQPGMLESERVTQQVLRLLDLTDVASQPVGTLPGGRRKQVELARALLARPVLLILDEPGVGLDSTDMEKVAWLIAELARSGAAILVVDHNLDFVESIADQILTMELGRLSLVRATGGGQPGPPPAKREGDLEPYPSLPPARPADPVGTVRERPAISEHEPADDADRRPQRPSPGPAGRGRNGDGLYVASLRAGYGRLTVLHDIDLQVPAGEIVTIAGPNGAGKSTLLNSIAGTLPVQGGQIWFEGHRADVLPSYRRVPLGIALVPEGRQIFESISVRANLDVALFARGRMRADHAHRERVERVLDIFPALRKRLRNTAGSLSGGEQQMLAIARALMCEPKLLLLDEPMQGIAQALVEELTGLLRALTGSLTIIVAEPEPTISLGQRVVELRMGRLAHRIPATDSPPVGASEMPVIGPPLQDG